MEKVASDKREVDEKIQLNSRNIWSRIKEYSHRGDETRQKHSQAYRKPSLNVQKNMLRELHSHQSIA